MRSRSILLLLGVGLLAALAWIASRAGSRDADVNGAVAPDESVRTEVSEQVDADERVAETVEQLEADHRARNEPSSITDEFTEESATSPLAASDDRIVLRVVAHDTRTPIEGAQVLFFEERGLHVSKLLRRGAIDAQQATSESTTDADGRVSVPRPRDVVVVFARKDGQTGFTTLQPPLHRAHDIALAPDGSVRVRVVDLTGAPLAGIPVTLRNRSGPYRRDYGVFTTDARGEAELAHARMLVTTMSSNGGQWFATVRGVFDTPIQQEVTHASLGAVVELSVPPFGSCDVEIRDARGELDRRASDVGLDVTRAKTSKREVFPAILHDGVLVEDVVDGVAHISVVQLGRELHATVKPRASETSVEANGLGPVTAGSNVKLTVSSSQSLCTFVGRLVTRDSSLVRADELLARIDRLDGRFESAPSVPVDVADDGAFRVSFRPRSEAFETRLVLHTLDAMRMEERAAHALLPDTLSAGEFDLGELVLDDAPLLADGVVLDSHGAPLAGVTVGAMRPRRIGDREVWHEWRDLQTATDGSGSFTLRTSNPAKQFRVVATLTRHQVQSAILSAHAENLVLRADSTGTLAGRCLLSEGFRTAGLCLVLKSDDATRTEPQKLKLDPNAPDGEFEMRDLAAGDYTVSVVDALGLSTFVELARVRVTADEVTRDPRLDPLDLREVLRRIELTAIASDGAPLDAPWVISRVRWGDGRTVVQRHFMRDGKLDIVCASEGVDVRIGAYDRAEVEALGLVANAEFELQPSPRVQLSLPDDVAALLGEHLRIRAALRRDSFEPEADSYLPTSDFESKSLEIAAPASGRTSLELWLWVHKSGRNTTRIPMEPPQAFQVDGALSQVDVRITPADIARAVEMLRDP